MQGLLTHKATMLLARERLSSLKRSLETAIALKAAAGQVQVIEYEFVHLVRQALEMLSAQPHPSTELPGAPWFSPVGEGVSKFAVMGTLGPSLIRQAARLSSDQISVEWLTTTLRSGHPDPQHAPVHARSTDFIFEQWRAISTAIQAEIDDSVEREQALAAARAFILGQLCRVASDVVLTPYINEVLWTPEPETDSSVPDNSAKKAGGWARLEARVAHQVLKRKYLHEAEGWDAWWPTPGEVPSQLYAGYAAAVNRIYPLDASRQKGSGEFEALAAETPFPTVDADLVEEGYEVHRAAMTFGYGYGLWSWFGILTPVFVPLLLVPPVAASLPHAQQLFRPAQPGDDWERAWYELLTLPMAISAVIPFGYGIWLASITTQGVETETTLNLIGAGVSVGLAATFFATLGIEDLHPGFRWALFAVPAAVGVIHLIQIFRNAFNRDRRLRALQSLIYGIPFLILLAVLGYYLLRVILRALGNENSQIDTAAFWLQMGIWLLGIGTLWFFAAKGLRDAFVPEPHESTLPELPRGVRLFDDTSLQPTADGLTLETLAYPSSGRKLLKLWWTGTGDLYIRSDRYQLIFNFTGVANPATDQVISAPLAPMTLSEFAQLLTQSVKDASNTTGKLLAAPVFPEEADYALPTGETFAHHGDFLAPSDDTLETHQALAKAFIKLGTAQDDTSYVLKQSPRAAQSLRIGVRGPEVGLDAVIPPQRSSFTAPNGYEFVPQHGPVSDGMIGHGDTLMDTAADLAALLCLGAVPHLTPPSGRVVDTPDLTPDGQSRLEPAYEVFRNWNLDNRRVNEWRMLVTGGALSEKGNAPDVADPLMTPPSDPAWRSRVPEGERIATREGWVPLLRKWLTVSQNPMGDVGNPELRSRPAEPTHLELSQGLAFLLNLTGPKLNTSGTVL